MGNIMTRRHRRSNDISKLEDKIKNIDTNNDGKVSKEEFIAWKDKIQHDMENYKNLIIAETSIEYRNRLDSKEKEIEELHQEVATFKKIIQQKKEKLAAKTEIIERNETYISEERIEEFVDELLLDENINIAYLPDWVEKQIYLNILTILVGFINKTAKTAKVELLGHEINFKVSPQ